jgi:hypothetical protein
MSRDSLIDKLVLAGAVEKLGRGVSFTNEFAGHVVWTVGTSALMEMTVRNWLDVLRDFHPTLGSLTPDEVADTVLLFDYYLSNPETPVVT